MAHKKQPRKPILIFNRKKKLAFIAASVYEAARYGRLHPGNVTKACTGETISNGKYYFRYVDHSVEIEFSDIGTLTLEEYDEICGIQRPIYSDSRMTRKKINYTKNN